MIKAVLFDFDGVLFDSEHYHQYHYQLFLKDYHYDIPKERLYKLICGDRTTDLWGKVLEGYEDKIDREKFIKDFQQSRNGIHEYMNMSKLLFLDVPKALEELKKRNLQIVCASSSPVAYLEKGLNEGKIRQYFDFLVSGHDFKQSKPNPEIYLFCANKLGLDPSECIVVEDSENGITAAKRAKMKVAARIDHTFGFDQSPADYFIEDLSELPAIVDELNK